MSNTAQLASPGRLPGIDLARAVAIVGMVIVNFNVAIGASSRGPDGLVWLTGLIPARAAVTFVMLAGMGCL